MKTFRDMQDSRQLKQNDTGDTMFTYFNSYYIGIPTQGGEFHLSMPNKEYFSHDIKYLEQILWNNCIDAEMNAYDTAKVKALLKGILGLNTDIVTDSELHSIAKAIPAGHAWFSADEMINLKRWLG